MAVHEELEKVIITIYSSNGTEIGDNESGYELSSGETTEISEEVTKSGKLLPLGKNSLLSKIGDQHCDRKCYL